MKWSPNTFTALAAVAWADGVMSATESSALLRAASLAGLAGADLAAVEAMTQAPVTLDQFSPEGLSADDAEYVYALACVMSAADGHVDLSERACIARLGASLALPESSRQRAELAGVLIARELGLSTNALEALSREMG